MHFYTAEGKPAHFQTTKTGVNKGKLRPTTIRDAKAQGLRASVTGITGVLNTGDGLANWMAKEAVKKFALKVYDWVEGVTEATNYAAYFNIDTDYKERDYAAEGTVVHNAIEDWIEAGMPETTCPHCLAAKEVFEKYGVTNPISEASFATEDFGGAVDIHCKEQNIIIDWKTKDGDLSEVKGKKFIYDTHPMQLTAYAAGLEMKEPRLVNVFLSRTHAGTWCDYEHKPEEISRGWEMFKTCLALWKLKNRV